MAIVKTILKVPLTKSVIVPDFIDIDGTDKYYYRLDVYHDDTWNPETQRKIVVHFPGAGVNAPYGMDSEGALVHVAAGYVWAVCYYYQVGFEDPNSDVITTKLPWNESWNTQSYNFQHHLRCRAFMIQSVLEYLCEKFNSLPIMNIDVNNIFFTGKSRGGASLLAWSYHSRAFNYSNRVKAIVNFQGYIGSSDVGWIDWQKTIRTLCTYFTWLNHKFYHVYNDLDRGYEISASCAYSIPHNRLSNSSFINMIEEGHTYVADLSLTCIQAVAEGSEPEYRGVSIKTAEDFVKEAINHRSGKV